MRITSGKAARAGTPGSRPATSVQQHGDRTAQPVTGSFWWALLRRAAVFLVPVLAMLTGLGWAMDQGVLAAPVSVSGGPFTLTATRFTGHGFEQFPGAVRQADGTRQPVTESVIGSAAITGMCQSVKAGPVTLRITAGNDGTPVSASNLIIDASSLRGDVTFTWFSAGQDASSLDKAGAAGPPGAFGQQASEVIITHLSQQTWATTAGTFKLAGLHVQFGAACGQAGARAP